jgi:hypothetical protein
MVCAKFTSAPTQNAQAWLTQLDFKIAALGAAELNTQRLRSFYLGNSLGGEAWEWFEGYLLFEEQFPTEPSLLDTFAGFLQDFISRFMQIDGQGTSVSRTGSFTLMVLAGVTIAFRVSGLRCSGAYKLSSRFTVSSRAASLRQYDHDSGGMDSSYMHAV